MCIIINVLNCWKNLKTTKLQRDDEKCVNVNAVKTEKISCIAYGQNLSAEIMVDQQLRSE